MIKLAVPLLFDAVVARFATEGPYVAPGAPVPNLFGWRQVNQQLVTGTRIVWVPGDDRSGNVGVVNPARHPGRNPRPLHTVAEFVTVYIHARDESAPEDELAQYRVARILFDAWLRAVYRAAHGTYTIAATSWVGDKKERRSGATLRVLLAVEAMVPDAVQPLAPVDTHVAVEVEIDSNGDGVVASEELSTEVVSS